MNKTEIALILRALKAQAIALDSRAHTAQFSNERCAAMDERNDVIALAQKLAERHKLVLHNGAEKFSEFLSRLYVVTLTDWEKQTFSEWSESRDNRLFYAVEDSLRERGALPPECPLGQWKPTENPN